LIQSSNITQFEEAGTTILGGGEGQQFDAPHKPRREKKKT
jgi:hypothetical protein